MFQNSRRYLNYFGGGVATSVLTDHPYKEAGALSAKCCLTVCINARFVNYCIIVE